MQCVRSVTNCDWAVTYRRALHALDATLLNGLQRSVDVNMSNYDYRTLQ